MFLKSASVGSCIAYGLLHLIPNLQNRERQRPCTNYLPRAAEEATGSALAAGASAGAGNAAAAAPVGKQPSARQSRKLEK